MPKVGKRTHRLYLKEIYDHLVNPLMLGPLKFRAWNEVLDTKMLYFSRFPSELGKVTAGFGSRATGIIDVRAANRHTQITIGKFVTIGRNVKIFDTFAHNPDAISVMNPNGSFGRDTPDDEIPNMGPIVIGNDVGIADDVIIMGGTTLEDGSGVAARSLVMGKVPAYCGWYGSIPNPIVRPRIPKEYAERLLKLQWWDLPPDVIWEARKLLITSDIAMALPKLEAIAAKTRGSP